MVEFEESIGKVIKIKKIQQTHFKKIELTPMKTIYFIFQDQINILNGHVTSGNISPVGFIFAASSDFYYCSLNGEKMDESVIKKFVDEFYNQ